MTDEQAILRCQDGEREAFCHVVDEYKDVLYGTALDDQESRRWPRSRSRRPSWRHGEELRTLGQAVRSSPGLCASW